MVQPKQSVSTGWSWRPKQPSKVNSPTQKPAPWSQWSIIKGHTFLFGIDWEFSPFSSSKNKELQKQRKNGNFFYAISTMEDVVGYVKALPETNGKKYAAALHLADRLSQGGIEIFCFHLKDDLYSFIALSDSKPVPGHDYIGSKENVWQLGNDFANLQEQQAIRYVGNAGIFQMEESVSLEKAFSNPTVTAQFKNIVNQPLLLGLILGLVVVFGISYGVDSYLTAVKIKEEQKRMELLNNPNHLYEQQIDKALKEINAGGREQIDNWMATIGKLPLDIAGWQLDNVNCNLKNCTATWKRRYGNFSELFRAVPVPFVGRSESMDAKNPENSIATTVHALAFEPRLNTLTRDELPKAKEVLSQISSQLQDLSLLEKTTVSLEKVGLFPANMQGTPDTLLRPVVRGGWEMQLELWSISSLNLSPNVVPESLTIHFPADKQGSSNYSLKGSFYARYK